jgi:hypothetical protein
MKNFLQTLRQYFDHDHNEKDSTKKEFTKWEKVKQRRVNVRDKIYLASIICFNHLNSFSISYNTQFILLSSNQRVPKALHFG